MARLREDGGGAGRALVGVGEEKREGGERDKEWTCGMRKDGRGGTRKDGRGVRRWA